MSDLYFQKFEVNRKDYEQRNGHISFAIWLTGLSGSGKSTIANGLNERLFKSNHDTMVLDGDNTRLGINKDLSFHQKDRSENIRRVAEISKLFIESGKIIITSFISPYSVDREMARQVISPADFIEVHIQCSLEECEKRDVKGLYAKARNGEINNFTGISSPYEEPINPDITVNSEKKSIDESIDYIFKRITEIKCLNID